MAIWASDAEIMRNIKAGLPHKTTPYKGGYMTKGGDCTLFIIAHHIEDIVYGKPNDRGKIERVVRELGKPALGVSAIFGTWEDLTLVEKLSNGRREVRYEFINHGDIILAFSRITEIFNGGWAKPKYPTTVHNLVSQLDKNPWWKDGVDVWITNSEQSKN